MASIYSIVKARPITAGHASPLRQPTFCIWGSARTTSVGGLPLSCTKPVYAFSPAWWKTAKMEAILYIKLAHGNTLINVQSMSVLISVTKKSDTWNWMKIVPHATSGPKRKYLVFHGSQNVLVGQKCWLHCLSPCPQCVITYASRLYWLGGLKMVGSNSPFILLVFKPAHFFFYLPQLNPSMDLKWLGWCAKNEWRWNGGVGAPKPAF